MNKIFYIRKQVHNKAIARTRWGNWVRVNMYGTGLFFSFSFSCSLSTVCSVRMYENHGHGARKALKFSSIWHDVRVAIERPKITKQQRWKAKKTKSFHSFFSLLLLTTISSTTVAANTVCASEWVSGWTMANKWHRIESISSVRVFRVGKKTVVHIFHGTQRDRYIYWHGEEYARKAMAWKSSSVICVEEFLLCVILWWKIQTGW